MISILFAALCVAYEPSNGGCSDRQIMPAGMWEGPTAPLECEAELLASRQRLEAEDLNRHFVLYCEAENNAE
jgi:hypothetical protein